MGARLEPAHFRSWTFCGISITGFLIELKVPEDIKSP